MKVLFPDTNLFLQCKSLEQLPWEEITGDNILLLISRPVQEEIDKLKQSGNSRRAKRARIATSFFREIIAADNIIIRQDKPHVEISFSPPIIQENVEDYKLNLSRVDDQIIFEAINYRNDHKEHDVALLTHDTGPLVTAKFVEFPSVCIPDKWLLSPETDSRDKRIAELELKVRELEKSYPNISIECVDADNKVITSLPIKLPNYQPIEQSQITIIMESIKTRFPLTTDFNSQTNEDTIPHNVRNILGAMQFLKPKEEQIQKYINEDYPKWLEEIERLLTTLNTKLDLKFCNIEISISISNIGNVPAENVVVDFILHKGLLIPPPFEFLDEKETPQNISLNFPNPPSVPKGGWVHKGILGFPFNHLQNPGLLSTINPLPSVVNQHDKYCFYWKPHRPTTKMDKWTLECDEFRHQIQAEVFAVSVHFPPEFIDKKSALEIIVAAKNLPKPVKYVLPIELEYATNDTVEYAYSLINEMKLT